MPAIGKHGEDNDKQACELAPALGVEHRGGELDTRPEQSISVACSGLCRNSEERSRNGVLLEMRSNATLMRDL